MFVASPRRTMEDSGTSPSWAHAMFALAPAIISELMSRPRQGRPLNEASMTNPPVPVMGSTIGPEPRGPPAMFTTKRANLGSKLTGLKNGRCVAWRARCSNGTGPWPCIHPKASVLVGPSAIKANTWSGDSNSTDQPRCAMIPPISPERTLVETPGIRCSWRHARTLTVPSTGWD